MSNVYITTKFDFDTTLGKRITRITKKLDKAGIPYTYNILGTVVKNVPIMAVSYPTKELVKVGSRNIECVEYTFEMDAYKLGDYTLVAIIEHCTNGNLVYEYEPVPVEYRTVSSKCEHCNSNRVRNRTAVLRTGATYIQVGLNCMREYTGIDCDSIIRGYTDVSSIMFDDTSLYIMDGELSSYKTVIDTVTYLAHCIKHINRSGYVAKGAVGATAEVAFDDAYKDKPIESEYYELANTVISYFKDINNVDTFINNIKITLSHKYVTKVNGFIAYAYKAYTKAIETACNKEETTHSKVSEYVGTVGDKLTFNATLSVITSYDTYYGTTYIYKLVDASGNIFVWRTSKGMWDILEDINIDPNTYNSDTVDVTVTGTVKSHTDKYGDKQTELTRCRIKVLQVTA